MTDKREQGYWKTRLEKLRDENPPKEDDVCTMCGKFCAIKQVSEYFKSP